MTPALARTRPQAEEEAAAAAKKKAEEEARARAKEEAELREIFRLADTDRSGYIDETELLDLGKAVNPNFTPEKCRVLLNKMDTSRDGQLSPSEFIEFVFKFMEAFTAPQREKGLKEMRKAAEGLARKAEEARKQAEAKKKAEAEAEAEARKLFRGSESLWQVCEHTLACTCMCVRTHAGMHSWTLACMHTCLHTLQELLDLYDKLEHTKKMGIVYSANRVTDVSSGTSAERMGVQPGWRIAVVCWLHGGCVAVCCMPAACCTSPVTYTWMWGCGMRDVACHVAPGAGEWHRDAERQWCGVPDPPPHRRDQEKGRAHCCQVRRCSDMHNDMHTIMCHDMWHDVCSDMHREHAQ
jgi:hypothetical protein